MFNCQSNCMPNVLRKIDAIEILRERMRYMNKLSKFRFTSINTQEIAGTTRNFNWVSIYVAAFVDALTLGCKKTRRNQMSFMK